jgi:TM2 domain-containing membrane protein YozV
MNCSYHPTNTAAVQCSRCARPLCPACDHRIRGFPYCQDCIVAGVELLQYQSARGAAPAQTRRKSSRVVALLLSFLLPGLGAAYNGQISKAVVHFAIFAGFFQMATITDANAFFVLGALGMWLFAAVDAYRTAQLIRSGLAPDAESDAIARRLYGNPIAWAIVLVVLGGTFLLHTMFGFVLPISKLLPVALVLLGAYMLFDHLRTRRGRDLTQFEQMPTSALIGSAPAGMPRFRTGDLTMQTRRPERRPHV